MALSLEEKEKRKNERRQKRWRETHKIIGGADFKICSICNNIYLSTEEFYYPNKTNHVDGLHPYCIECTKKKNLQWQYDNYEYWKTIVAKRDATPIKRDATRAHSKRQKKEGYYKGWLINNKDKTKLYSNDRSQHKTHEISDEEWVACKEYFNNSCAYCELHIKDHYRIYAGKPQKIDLHKEHVDHNGNNKIDNCIPSCLSCNSKKHDKELSDWYNKNNEKYTLYRFEKIHRWLTEYKSIIN